MVESCDKDIKRSTNFNPDLASILHLLVEGLGVGGGGRNVGVTGSLVGAGGELELVSSLEVGIAGGAVGGSVVTEVEKEGEHFCKSVLLVQCLIYDW